MRAMFAERGASRLQGMLRVPICAGNFLLVCRLGFLSRVFRGLFLARYERSGVDQEI